MMIVIKEGKIPKKTRNVSLVPIVDASLSVKQLSIFCISVRGTEIG